MVKSLTCIPPRRKSLAVEGFRPNVAPLGFDPKAGVFGFPPEEAELVSVHPAAATPDPIPWPVVVSPLALKPEWFTCPPGATPPM